MKINDRTSSKSIASDTITPCVPAYLYNHAARNGDELGIAAQCHVFSD